MEGELAGPPVERGKLADQRALQGRLAGLLVEQAGLEQTGAGLGSAGRPVEPVVLMISSAVRLLWASAVQIDVPGLSY